MTNVARPSLILDTAPEMINPDAFDPSTLIRDYGDIAGEVAACRCEAALFDFSFISSAGLSGPGLVAALAAITERTVDNHEPGRIRYALRHGQAGFIESDLTLWNSGARTLVMSGRKRDLLDLADLAAADCEFESFADKAAIFAVQGPNSLDVFDGLTNRASLAALPYFGFSTFNWVASAA